MHGPLGTVVSFPSRLQLEGPASSLPSWKLEARWGGAPRPDHARVGRIPSRPVAPGWGQKFRPKGPVAAVLHLCALRPALEAGLVFSPRSSGRQVPGLTRVAFPQCPPPEETLALVAAGVMRGGRRAGDGAGTQGVRQGAQLGRCTAEGCEAPQPG